MNYNWQLPDWPKFKYDIKGLEPQLLSYAQISGKLSGTLEGLGAPLRDETLIDFMVTEAIKSSKIEGEEILFEDVKSSILNQLGLNKPPKQVDDLRAKGIAQMMLHVNATRSLPLDESTLFQWHDMLFLGQSGRSRIKTGGWRTHEDPMQIVSGPYGKWKIHFEAPPWRQGPFEMERFIQWFNDTAPSGSTPIVHAPIRAAIAHLYFETIHPFEDGNGRIGRAISEKALLQQSPFVTILSLSTSIEAKKKAYYDALQQAQKSNEITDWLEYFLHMLLKAQEMAEASIRFIMNKTNFMASAMMQTNERQLKVLNRLLEEGPGTFVGGINAKKYGAIGKCSKTTATRELSDLLEKGLLKKLPAGGRSTAYELNF